MVLLPKIFEDRLTSTNARAQEMLQNQEASGNFWLRAGDQFAGKGHGSNIWLSQPGMNLTGSLVIYPENLKAADQFTLSVLISLGLTAFLDLFTEYITIKWPNDVYYQDQKIAGILIENAIVGDRIKYTVIGVGININQLEFPKALPNPTSLKKITGIDYDLEELEDLLLTSLQSQLDFLQTGVFDEVSATYLQRLYRYKSYAPFREPGKPWFNARIIGIESDGHLVLEDEGGVLKSYGFKEVEFIL